MTAPQSEATPSTARKTAPKKAPTKVTSLPVAEKAAAKAAHPASAAKQDAKKATARRVAPLPREQWKLPTPAKLEWTPKTVKDVEYQMAVGARHLYRVHQGDDGSWYGSQKLKQGSWSPMAGACKTVDDAKTLAGWNEAGALWLAYTSVAGVPFEKLMEDYKA